MMMDGIEKKLWDAYWQDRSIANRNALAEHYLSFVTGLAHRKFQTLPMCAMLFEEDLVTYGMLGLIKAIESYQPHRGRFGTFAYNGISFGIINGLREMGVGRKYHRAGVRIRVVHLSDFLSEKSQEYLESVLSYDQPDMLALWDTLQFSLRKLTPRMQGMLMQRHGYGLSYCEVGKRFNLSESRAHRITQDAFWKAKREALKNGV